MAHFLTSADKYRDPRDFSGGYRFGGSLERSVGKRAGAAAVFNRVNGYLKTAIEAIVDSKIRRMKRELELCGIRSDRSCLDAHNPGRTGED
jgi:hypothetical protein